MHYKETWWDKRDKDKKTTEVVEDGDMVAVEYKGWFADNGLIFDTNIRSVGDNATQYPKSATFDKNKQYDELKFTVGGPQMIKGFDRGVVGMKKDETRTITVSPELGYGLADQSLIFNISIVETIPTTESMSRTDFSVNYTQENPEQGVTFSHGFWGWPCKIVSMDNYTVTLQNMPEFGQNYKGFAWNTTVTGISTAAGTISLRHTATQKDSGGTITPERFRMLRSDLPDGVSDPGLITVQNNQISIDFNREVVGKTLIFEVTVKEITK